VFDTVLIAIDEDSHAQAAVRIGGRLAKDLAGSVIVFHVVPPAPTYATQAGLYLPAGELRKAATEHGKEVLQEAAAHVPEGVPVRLVVKYGEHSPWREIVQVAQREAVDLIVIGAHSQGALKRPTLGSTAEKVSRHVTVPVLLVR
jgi:nucleotide-binding universal stress UspA family protein